MSFLFKTLKQQHQKYKSFLIIYLLLILVGATVSVVTMRMTGDMAGTSLEADTSALFHVLVIITALTAIHTITSAISALMLGRFAGRAGYKFRDNFAKFFLRSPFAKFEEANSGQSLSIYSNDLPQALELVAGEGIRMIAGVISLLVTFAYMMWFNTSLSIIFFAAFPVLVVMQVVISIPIQKKSAATLEKQAAFTATVNDSLQNTSTIAAYSLEDVIQARCNNAMSEFITAIKKQVIAFLPLVMTGMIATMAPLLIVVVIAAYRIINETMNMAEFVAFISLASSAGGWLGMLSQRQTRVQVAAGGAKRLLEAVSGDVEVLTDGGTIKPQGEFAVSATNLSFAYPARGENTEENLVLDNISFQIKKGAKVAFVGGSGSGKSTVLKLLLRLYNPAAGSIELMGTDMSALSLEAVRGAYAYVPQDSFLFPESIGTNITGQDHDMARLQQACRDAGILEFIESLPDKFDAVLNESAENVSGGQKQRIALARAFYRNSPIILFDEATSALDPATESAILQSFDTLSKDRTVIMVAHRVKPISFCDTIIVMDGGKIAATGTHDQLLVSSPIYKNLYDSQNKEVLA